MKKTVLFLTLALISVSIITGCRSNTANTSDNSKVTTEKKTGKESETEKESEISSTTSSTTAGNKSSSPENSNSSSSNKDTASGAETSSASDATQSTTSEVPQQGWDSIVLYDINLNGITVMRGTDGTGNWYDENGVSYGNLDTVDDTVPITNGNGEVYYWNAAFAEQAVGSSASAVSDSDINDPYDLYSWDAGTSSYIPYQQADSDASPIGRGNGWYYYDAATGSYQPW